MKLLREQREQSRYQLTERALAPANVRAWVAAATLAAAVGFVPYFIETSEATPSVVQSHLNEVAHDNCQHYLVPEVRAEYASTVESEISPVAASSDDSQSRSTSETIAASKAAYNECIERVSAR